MCLVVIGTRVLPNAPLVIGGNREEFYARGGTVPQMVSGNVRFVAGLDPAAGGTWLGVNERGLVVAVTNRPKASPPPASRSRGLLVRDLLAVESLGAATERACQALASNMYAGCNLLCADARGAVVLHCGDDLEVRDLEPGWHALTAKDVDDRSDQRIDHSIRFLDQARPANATSAVACLKNLCAGSRDPVICLHGQDRGTVSSSILALTDPLADSIYWHCQGSPDQKPYQDYTSLLRSLTTGRGHDDPASHEPKG